MGSELSIIFLSIYSYFAGKRANERLHVVYNSLVRYEQNYSWLSGDNARIYLVKFIKLKHILAIPIFMN